MFVFKDDVFEKIFPFIIKFDQNLNIVCAGKSIQKVLGDVTGKRFDQVFKFVRPKLSISNNFESFLEHQDTIIILEATEYPVKTTFRGQFLYDENSNQILYLNSPWITHTLDLELHNLLITDFALHDTMTDVMQLLRSKEIVNEDLTNVNEKLIYQRDELIQSKHTLGEVTSRFQTLIESMNSAILAENKDRKIILVNELFCNMFSIPLNPDAMVGMDCSKSAEDTKHLFQDETTFIQRIESILANKTQVFGDLLYMKDGRILERDYVPIIENGIYTGHIWKYQDVTEIVKDKISISNTEEKYRRIIENLKFGLIEVDTNEIITKVYPAFCELSGYSQEELIGQYARTLLAVPEDDKIMDIHLDKRKHGESSVYERKLLIKSGEIKYFIVSGTPIFNSENQVVGSMGIHIDITERKNLEKELIEAKESAIESMKMKEMFLANISHEIRTPMNAIIGLSDVLFETDLTEEQFKFLSAIKISSTNLLSLINDILDFSKIESGKLELERIPFVFDEIIENLKEISGIKARQKSLDLHFVIDQNLARVFNSDALKLTQVLINLISNSLKFTSKGYVALNIAVLEDAKDHQRVRFSVIDTGVGIEEGKLDRIFDTFNQEDISVSRKYGGTGLGLSISQGIVRAFDSMIHVKSEKDKGSEFYFDIQLEKGNILVQEKAIDEKISFEYVYENLNILIAEDNAFNQMLIKAIFDKLPFKYNVVENGKKVIEALEVDAYDLILMDIQMPEMDGLTTTNYIRNQMNLEIPIIALTANAGKEDESVYLKSGMNGYLSKPFKKEELLKKIYNLQTINKKVMKERNYNLEILSDLSNGNQDFIIDMINTFRKTIPSSLESLILGLEQKDYQTIKNVAHQIKPSIDIMGIDKIKKLVKNLELHCTEESIDKHYVHDAVFVIRDEIQLVLKQIDEDFD